MALTTRLYYARRDTTAGGDVPPAITPAFSPTWNTINSGGGIRVALLPARGGTSPNLIANSGVESGLALGSRRAAVQGVGPALPAGEIAGTFRAALRAVVTNAAADMSLAINVRVVAADGVTVRGVLVSEVQSAEVGTTSAVRTLGPIAMTPVVAVAGDRLVVEYGAYRASSAMVARAVTMAIGDPTVGPDEVFSDGDTTAGAVPWVEITQLPPNAPTDLLGTPDVTSVTLNWTAPATGPTPTGYTITVNGGALINVGDMTSFNVAGLTPATSYTFAVRAYNGAGNSLPTVVTVVTTVPTPEPPVLLVLPRTFRVAAEARTATVQSNDRSFVVDPEIRTLGVLP